MEDFEPPRRGHLDRADECVTKVKYGVGGKSSSKLVRRAQV